MNPVAPASPTANPPESKADADATQDQTALLDAAAEALVSTRDPFAVDPAAPRASAVSARADGTQELAPDDILEVEEIANALLEETEETDERGSLDVFNALARKRTSANPAFVPQERAPDVAPRAYAETRFPSSLPPMAIDVTPPPPMPAPLVPAFPRARADSTAGQTETFYGPLPMKKVGVEAIVAAVALGTCALVGVGAFVATLALSRPNAGSHASNASNTTNATSATHATEASNTSAAPHLARPSALLVANEATIEKPVLATTKTGRGLAEPHTQDVTALPAAPMPAEKASPSAPSPPPAFASSTPRAQPGGGAGTGVLRVSPLLRGVLVDGTPRAVHGGAVVLTCGRHTLKTPNAPSRVVDVPCGGQTSL